MFSVLFMRLQLAALTTCQRLLVLAQSARQSRATGERGQTSAEYALVLLGAAAVALLIVAWATKSDLVGKLFDTVLKAITGKVK